MKFDFQADNLRLNTELESSDVENVLAGIASTFAGHCPTCADPPDQIFDREGVMRFLHRLAVLEQGQHELTAAVSDLQLRLDRLQAGHEQLTSQVERDARDLSRLVAVVERLAGAMGKPELLEAESA